MTEGQQRGWVIIGIDLLIVFGVYLLYSQFVVAPSTNELTLNDELRYELTVEPVRGDTIPLTFSVANATDRERTVDLPEGIVLFLARGTRTEGRDKFWATRPHDPGTLSLAPGETRTWSYSPTDPEDVEDELFVALFIDESRQGKVEVPR